MSVETIGGFVVMTEDEVLEHLLELEAKHGTVNEIVIDFAINYPMVKSEQVWFKCETNALYGTGSDWRYQGEYSTLQDAIIAGTEVCYDSDTQRKVHITCDGLSAYNGVMLPGGLQGSFYDGFNINS